jgi:hypothetical protein
LLGLKCISKCCYDPLLVEVAIKTFLYDIFFGIESVSEEGWNDESVSLEKRPLVEMHGLNNPIFDKSSKKLETRKKKGRRN